MFIAALALTLISACTPSTLLAPPELPPQAGETVIAASDGMTLVYVPGGPFVMGSQASDPNAQPDESPQRTVTLDGFWIDRTEVTNERYTACVKAGVCAPIVSPRSDMIDRPDLPVIGVAWGEASAYCAWVGRRLPTEAEWEKAARGANARLYPWGDQLDTAMLVNIDFRVGDFNDVGANSDDRSPYGVMDMAGNAPEWVADWYQSDAYAQGDVVNPQGPAKSMVRVQRGGAWNAAPSAARAANRFWAFPDRNDFTGFRCAGSQQ
ncbi:MAG: SUMF1/EgtB/PvdO family nonheme iron enzyme [Caldilineales bacterium]|nr:SUMF1/EgtB/PvdO family nonheme iron enzyme [Caldilineales bacterium]